MADERYSLETLLSSQPYLMKHRSVPRDLAVLPFQILVHHVEETLSYVQKLGRELTSTEKRIAEGSISLEENGDYKLLNRLNLEQLRLQRRSNFELELAKNLMKYFDEYEKIWIKLWEGGTSYLEEMREKIEQQTRYAEQVKVDIDVIPQRIKNQSKTVSDKPSVVRGSIQCPYTWTFCGDTRGPNYCPHTRIFCRDVVRIYPLSLLLDCPQRYLTIYPLPSLLDFTGDTCT